ncbi:MAG: hypothetical protein R3F34_04215 [Planctomycetota bacterium]
MKSARFAAPLLLLAASCSSLGGGFHQETLMSTGRVTVTAALSRQPNAWSLRDIVASGPSVGSVRLQSLSVIAFADLDDDDKVGPEERRGAWSVSSNLGTQRLAASGKIRVSEIGAEDNAALKLEVRVRYWTLDSKLDEDVAVVPFGD